MIVHRGSLTTELHVAIQAFASVTVTLYVPLYKPESVALVDVKPFGPVQQYVYAGVPPAGVTLAVPSLPPLVVASVLAHVTLNWVGSEIGRAHV